jgi:four helix bundle protein
MEGGKTTEQSFEALKVWQKAHQLMLDINNKLIPILLKEGRYSLTDQIRRSSRSVSANIAEGSGRFFYMDNFRFCYQARGSLDEIINHLNIAHDLKNCQIGLYTELRDQVEEIRRLLNGYITWLKTQKIGAKEPGVKLCTREIPAEYIVQPEGD